MLRLRELFSRTASAPAPTLPRPLKATVLDTLTPRGALLAAAAFFGCVIITLIAGGAGPTASASSTYALTAFPACANAASCGTVFLSTSLTKLTHLNQATWVTAQLMRPKFAVPGPNSGQLVSAATAIRFPLAWTLTSIAKNGALSLVNSSHVTNVFCPPFEEACAPFVVFAQVLTAPSAFTVTISVADPLAAFSGFAGIDPAVVFKLNQGYVAEAYTSFEAGFKVFYCVVSACLLAFYVWSLASIHAPGGFDAEGNRLTNTHEQLWVLVLGVSVFWFDDPLVRVCCRRALARAAVLCAPPRATLLQLRPRRRAPASHRPHHPPPPRARSSSRSSSHRACPSRGSGPSARRRLSRCSSFSSCA